MENLKFKMENYSPNSQLTNRLAKPSAFGRFADSFSLPVAKNY